MIDSTKIRNIAIVAHVDHGKTTLIDKFLKETGSVIAHRELEDRAMDSNDIEKERGITILAKCTSMMWKDHKVNIIDTPGHADFGGEVERVLGMVDSVLLVVDAFEGPMPQTKFVLKKSLQMGHQPIVVINKVDRPNSRPEAVLDMVFDLFGDLEATDEQLDFPVIYASAKEGYSGPSPDVRSGDLKPLLDMIISEVKAPEVQVDAPLQFQVATLQYDSYLGRILVGRVFAGKMTRNDRVTVCRADGSTDTGRLTKLWKFNGLERVEAEEVGPGDICALVGPNDVIPGETLCEFDNPNPLPLIAVDEPTLSMVIMVNNSPFSGREGKYLTSRQIRDRLDKELEHNVALKVAPTDRPEAFLLSGRGELHLSVLLETMRREGFEFQVSKPVVIYRTDENGNKTEPIEELMADVPADYSGTVIRKLNERKGEMIEMDTNADGTQRLKFLIPARCLIGYRSEFTTDTRGEGVMYTKYHEYGPYRGEIAGRKNGVFVATENGTTTIYALHNLQQRGTLFLGATEDVYGGQVIGENSRENDLVVNPNKKKQLTNVRSSGADDALLLTPPIQMSLEQALEYIQPDEWVEITPESIRIRKAELNHSFRKRKAG